MTAPTAADRTGTGRAATAVARRDAIAFFGVLAAPFAWLVHLAVGVALVAPSCRNDSLLWMHVTTVATALVAVAGIVVARAVQRSSSGGDGRRFLGRVGFWLGWLFLALIVLEAVPTLTLDPCL